MHLSFTRTVCSPNLYAMLENMQIRHEIKKQVSTTRACHNHTPAAPQGRDTEQTATTKLKQSKQFALFSSIKVERQQQTMNK